MPKRRPFTPTILLHAFTITESGDQEHVDSDSQPELVNGWSVCVRTDFHDDGPEPFDLVDATMVDFAADDRDGAEAYAAQLAEAWQAEIDRY